MKPEWLTETLKKAMTLVAWSELVTVLSLDATDEESHKLSLPVIERHLRKWLCKDGRHIHYVSPAQFKGARELGENYVKHSITVLRDRDMGVAAVFCDTYLEAPASAVVAVGEQA